MITLDNAQSILAAGEARANATNVRVSIAVVDGDAYLKAFNKMDGAFLGSIDVAMGKARTAALSGSPSEAIGEFARVVSTSPGLAATEGGLVAFSGGLPIKTADGTIIGAVGVSGGAVDQDLDIAEAAVAAFRP